MTNYANTHTYMKPEVNVMFTQMHGKKLINIFGERDIVARINNSNNYSKEQL